MVVQVEKEVCLLIGFCPVLFLLRLVEVLLAVVTEVLQEGFLDFLVACLHPVYPSLVEALAANQGCCMPDLLLGPPA